MYEITDDSIRVFSRNIKDKTTAFDLSCGLNRSEYLPQLTIHEPKTGTSFNKNLPITITAQHALKIETSLDGKNWISLKNSSGKFSQKIQIDFLCEGLHHLKLSVISSDGKL